MKKLLFMILIPLIIFPSPAYSKTMYVIDKITITVRTQPGLDFKIVDRLTSNEQVNILRVEGSWAQISFKDNQTGWVLKRYLAKEIPMSIQIAALKKTISAQAEKLEALEKEDIVLKQRKAEMVEIICGLKLENQKLMEGPYTIMLLLAGGGIFLFGSIMTLIVWITQRRRRKSSLSF
ncbi:MAG: TIGR04211 family SH3 domain-containing protein [Deltaproteobacteria bacterium]|nr:TIGR04211 family SH3 domain-containing protein [Deltaproteobacteria bacterium]